MQTVPVSDCNLKKQYQQRKYSLWLPTKKEVTWLSTCDPMWESAQEMHLSILWHRWTFLLGYLPTFLLARALMSLSILVVLLMKPLE